MPSDRTPPAGFYWSPSRHFLAKKCPACFVRKYVYLIPTLPEDNEALRYGSVLHEAMEGKKIDEEAVLKRDGFQTLNAIHAHLRGFDRYAQRIGFSEWDHPEYEFGKQVGIPLRSPSGEEHPFPFYGIVDRLLCNNPLDGDGEINPWGWVDYKTGTKAWSQSQIDGSDQFSFYTLAYRTLFGSDPKAYLINFIKDGEASVRPRRVSRTDEQLETLWRETLNLYDTLVTHATDVSEPCRRTLFCPYPHD